MQLKAREMLLQLLHNIHVDQTNNRITHEALVQKHLELQSEMLLDCRDLLLQLVLAQGAAKVEGAIELAQSLPVIGRR
jgi:hypothetical protein